MCIVDVGHRWNDPSNPFRVNEATKINSIPTLVNWTTVSYTIPTASITSFDSIRASDLLKKSVVMKD